MKVNLGAGSQPMVGGWVNVDSVDQPGIDVVHDLDVFPWPFADGTASEILGWDVYEHVTWPLEFMGECWRILRQDGTLTLHTSHWQNPDSYRDPTHKRFLTEESFDYWIPDTYLHRRYGAAYARGAKFALISLELDPDILIRLRKLA